jgi:DeoR family transcriptional regulator, suf operon transcriptional repressor
MSVETPTSDAGLLDLLRIAGPLGVSELSDAMEVTPTAVRQRLVRLLAQESIQREVIRRGRGRPKHRYWLTDKGVRLTGSNFPDLAMVLWKEVQKVDDVAVHKEALRRIARALAAKYAGQVQGGSLEERMRSLTELLAERRIPASVDTSDQGPVLTTHACPYPKLAEQDRDICSVERMMFSELLGQDMELTRCRREGGSECQFQPGCS